MGLYGHNHTLTLLIGTVGFVINDCRPILWPPLAGRLPISPLSIAHIRVSGVFRFSRGSLPIGGLLRALSLYGPPTLALYYRVDSNFLRRFNNLFCLLHRFFQDHGIGSSINGVRTTLFLLFFTQLPSSPGGVGAIGCSRGF